MAMQSGRRLPREDEPTVDEAADDLANRFSGLIATFMRRARLAGKSEEVLGVDGTFEAKFGRALGWQMFIPDAMALDVLAELYAEVVAWLGTAPSGTTAPWSSLSVCSGRLVLACPADVTSFAPMQARRRAVFVASSGGGVHGR